MAERYAVANGFWSDVSTWDGGTTLPGVNDDVHANGFNVTIDQDVTVLSLSTRPGVTAVAGGRFVDTQAAGQIARTINANCYAGTTDCLGLDNTAQGLAYTLNGDTYGSDTTSNRRGALIESGAIQNGDSYGGAASGAYGSRLVNGGTQNGNAYAGTHSNAYGSFVSARAFLNGNSYGGSSSSGKGAQITQGGIQNGDSFGGSSGSTSGSFVTNGGTQNGNSTGGTGGNSHGTQVNFGGKQFGQQTGSGTGTTNYGTLVQTGGIVITTGITDGTSSGLRAQNNSTIIRFNGVLESQVDFGTSWRYGNDNTNFPFINEPGSGSASVDPLYGGLLR